MAFLVPFVLTLHFTSGLYKPSEANSKDVVTNICVKTVGKANVANFGENDDAEDTLDMQPYQKCENTTTTNYCFTLWEESRTNSSITILRQGNRKFCFIYILRTHLVLSRHQNKLIYLLSLTSVT